MKKETKKAKITIDHGPGKKEVLVIPIISETTSGLVCGEDNSHFGSNKGEWFSTKPGGMVFAIKLGDENP